MSKPSRIIIGDVIEGLRTLDAGSVHCCVTSPPYWGLRDYGVDGQIGLEKTPEEFVGKMVEVFREVRRVLRDDGTLWLNLGDSYASTTKGSGCDGSSTLVGTPAEGNGQRFAARKLDIGTLKPKDLCMIPWRVALALQDDGWWLRSVICWAKKSPMPESVTDRPTSSWEPIFLLAKSERYFYDAEAVKEPLTDAAVKRQAYGRANQWGHIIDANQHADNREHADAKSYGADDGPTGRNQRNVWHLGPEPYAEAHFATFPTEIPRRAIKAGTSEKGCCAACGGPWRRVVELVGGRTSGRTPERQAAASAIGKPGGANYGSGLDMKDIAGHKTTGWEPTCTCGAAVVPCMVLDPFLGSGTTVAVARELGRYGVGCELNPEYAKLARERIGKAEKPATFRSDRVIDSPLFGGNDA